MKTILKFGFLRVFYALLVCLNTSILFAQCPTFGPSSIIADCITNGPPCVMCGFNKTVSLKVTGYNLPVGGCVNWYISQTSGFNPYQGEGLLMGCAQILANKVNDFSFATTQDMCGNGIYYVVGIIDPIDLTTCPQVFTSEFSFRVSCPDASIDTISRPCYGWPLNLTAPAGAINYIWSGPNNFSSNLQNPVIPGMQAINSGTYFLTVTDSYYCTAVGSLTTIMPVFPSIVMDPTWYNGPLQICPGEDLVATVYSFPSPTGNWNFNGWWNANILVSQDPSLTMHLGDIWVIVCLDPIYECWFAYVTAVIAADNLEIKIKPDQGIICYNDSLEIVASSENGLAPYDFFWNTGNISDNIELTSPGKYSVTVTDSKGCTGSASADYKLNPEIKISFFPDTAIICSNGSIKLSAIATGGSGSKYKFKWKTPIGEDAGANIIITEPGDYKVTVTDGEFCTQEASITVSSSTDLLVDVSPDPAEKCPFDTLILKPHAIGGSGIYTYHWSGPTGSFNTKNILAIDYGLYNITVTDDNGCTGLGEAEVSTKDDIPLTILPNPASFCPGDDITLEVSTNEGNITKYEWDTPLGAKIGKNIIANKEGQYSVTITNAKGCTGRSVISVEENSASEISISFGAATFCLGGFIKLTSSSLDTNISSFNWMTPSGPEVSKIITATIAGNYIVSITNEKGCTSSDTLTVNESPAVDVNISPDTASFCVGSSVNLTANSSAPDIVSYSWNTPSGPQSGKILNADIAGNYAVTVSNSFGCTASDNVDITEESMIAVSISPSPVSICPGNSIKLTASAITAGVLSYNWSTPIGTFSTKEIIASATGTYSVTINSSSGCSGTASIKVTEGASIPVCINPPTPGFCEGSSVDLIANAIGTNLSYKWFTPNGYVSGKNILATSKGEYSVTVTDEGGCTGSASIEVNEYPVLNIIIDPNPASFCNTGSALLTAINNNGTPPLMYEWDTPTGPGNNQSFYANTIGQYNITVTDAHGCTGTASSTVTQSNSLSVSILPLNAGFCAGKTIDLSVKANGGQSPYYYTWETPLGNINTITLSTGKSGNYKVTVTDSVGCSGQSDIKVDEFGIPILTMPGILGFCKGNDVSIEATVVDSLIPLMYYWTTPVGNSKYVSLVTKTPGDYNLTVTNSAGCSSTAQTHVDEWALPFIKYSPFPVQFCKGNSVDVIASATIGKSPFSYHWQGPGIMSNTNPLSISVIGDYSLTVTDANGCSTNTSFPAEESPGLIVDLLTDPPVLCGIQQFNILSETTGGIQPYNYYWETPIGVKTIANLTTDSFGKYDLTVTDSKGCTGTSSLTANDQSLFVVLDKTDPGCIALKSGSITLTSVINASYPIQLKLDNHPAISITSLPFILQSLQAGNYQLTLIANNGCEKVFNLELSAPSTPDLKLGDDVTIFLGESYTIIPTANFLIDSIRWTNKSSLDCTPGCVEPIASPQFSTTYKATAYSKDGCKATDDINIYVVEKESVYIPNSFSPNGDGINDQWLVFTDQTVKQIKKMYIYDRWGEAILIQENFPPNDPAYGWNGKFRNQLMNDSVFVFYVQVEFNDGRVKEYKGDINLLR